MFFFGIGKTNPSTYWAMAVSLLNRGAKRPRSRVGEPRLAPDFGSHGTFACHGPHFHADAIGQTGALLRDGDGFVHRADLEEKVATDCFLRFSERAIRHRSVLAGNDFAFALERIAGDTLALVLQAVEPGHPGVGDLLHLFRRKTPVPVRAAEDQHVSVVVWCTHIVCRVVEFKRLRS